MRREAGNFMGQVVFRELAATEPRYLCSHSLAIRLAANRALLIYLIP